jgi:hypothetical protein
MSYSLRLVMVGCVVAAPACMDPSDEVAPTAADPANELSFAAAPCTIRSDGKYTCFNRVPSPMFVNNKSDPINYLRTNPSWFQCRSEGAFSGGGPHASRWVLTEGDDNNAWGWVRDIDIASETDPVSVCSSAQMTRAPVPLTPKPVPTPPPAAR